MAFRKKTLRTMSPTARKVARLAGEIESAATRLKNLIPELQHLDLESAALKTATNPDSVKDARLSIIATIRAIVNRYDDLEIPKHEMLDILERLEK